MLKVVQLQYNLVSAGKQSMRLHHAFLKAGIDSSLLSLHSDVANDSRIQGLGNSYKMIARFNNRWADRLTRRSIKKFGLFSYPLFGSNVSKLAQVKRADIIYLHWINNGFLSLKSIEQLAKLNKPIIFVLHDMWSITGGCHYSFECEKYKTGCHSCPMFPEPKKNDLSAKEFRRKIRLYSKFDNLYFVSPSQWLYNCARESMLTKDKPVFHIPNLVDNTVYKPFDKRSAKQILNINPDETVIAFGAVSLKSPLKGWEYLQNALEILQKDGTIKNISVLVFGGGYNEELRKAIPFPSRSAGYLNDDYSMAVVYNAADIFIAPSLADNLPTTIFESMCCGTPVVAFNTGGIPDLVKHKLNGYLAKYRDAEDLAEGVKFCLSNGIKGNMLPVFEPSLTIQKHLELYEQIKSTKIKD